MGRIRATRKDFVLDVGSGSHPHSTADVLVERFLEDVHGHRSHTPAAHDRPLICADIHNLPFLDKTFDYAICNHVVEHVDDPETALAELSRVAKRGFLGVPSEFYEFICPTHTHKWVFALKDGVLLMKPLRDGHHLGLRMYGGIFFTLYALPEFRRLVSNRPDLFGVTLEWEDSIRFRLVDESFEFYDYSDAESVRELLKPAPADGPVDAVKRFMRAHLDPSSIERLSSLRAGLRRAMKKSSRAR